MTNPYLKRASVRGSMGHGGASEVRVAKSLAARLQPASGALRGGKSDSTAQRGEHHLRIESKSTINDSLSLDLGWLSKISEEAATSGSIPALTLSFVTPEGKPRLQRNAEWVAVPLWFLNQLLDDAAK